MSSLLRKASANDLGELAKIERAAARQFPPGRLPDPEFVLGLDVLDASFRSGLLFVNDVAGQLVGFACARQVGRYVHLDEMSVHPEFGRRGLGGQLLSRVLEEARSRLVVGVTLTTFADIPWNHDFYHRSGFKVVDRVSAPGFLMEKLEGEVAAGMTNRVAMIYLFDVRQGASASCEGA